MEIIITILLAILFILYTIFLDRQNKRIKNIEDEAYKTIVKRDDIEEEMRNCWTELCVMTFTKNLENREFTEDEKIKEKQIIQKYKNLNKKKN